MNRVKSLLMIAAIAVGVGVVMTPADAQAACTNPKDCVTQGVNSTGGTGGSTDIGTVIKSVINALLFIIGSVAVIMIVIGGLKYTVSNGDSSSVTSAKNTILYSVIGLVVAILGYAIVNFVVARLT